MKPPAIKIISCWFPKLCSGNAILGTFSNKLCARKPSMRKLSYVSCKLYITDVRWTRLERSVRAKYNSRIVHQFALCTYLMITCSLEAKSNYPPFDVLASPVSLCDRVVHVKISFSAVTIVASGIKAERETTGWQNEGGPDAPFPLLCSGRFFVLATGGEPNDTNIIAFSNRRFSL